MAVKEHPKGTFDGRRHNRGNNTENVVHAKLPHAKQASKVAVSQASTFTAAAGEHAVATHMPTAPKAPIAPGAPGKGA